MTYSPKVRGLQIQVILSIFFAAINTQSAYAKCWSMREYPSSFCAKFEVLKAIKSISSGCLITGKIKKIALQPLTSSRVTFDPGSSIQILADEDCAKFTVNNTYDRLITKTCQDKLPVEEVQDAYINYSGKVPIGGMGWADSPEMQCPLKDNASDQSKIISEAGIGKITSNSLVDADSLKPGLPGLSLKARHLYTEDFAIAESVEVSKGGKVLFKLVSSGVGSKQLSSLEIYDAAYSTLTGLHVGSPAGEFIKNFPNRRCIRGVEETQDEVTCSVESSAISYVMDLKGLQEESAGVQKPVAVFYGQGRVIKRIIWRPTLKAVKHKG